MTQINIEDYRYDSQINDFYKFINKKDDRYWVIIVPTRFGTFNGILASVIFGSVRALKKEEIDQFRALAFPVILKPMTFDD